MLGVVLGDCPWARMTVNSRNREVTRERRQTGCNLALQIASIHIEKVEYWVSVSMGTKIN